MKVSIAELKEKFGPSHDVAPYGECIVVQGTEFNPDWEAELGDQGYKCHFGDLDGHAVTFVQLKKAVGEGKAVYVPAKMPEVDSGASNRDRENWQPVEDAFLVSLWNQGLTIPEITKKVEEKYPSRKGNSANMRLKRLRLAGKIQPRQKRVSGNVEVKEVEKAIVKFGNGCQKGPDWSDAQVELLLARWEALGELPKETRATELAKLPEFAGRSANSILQKAYKLLKKPKTSKEAKITLETENERSTGKVASDSTPATTELGPKWNGEFGEKCNLPIDCVDCDITECLGRKSEGLQNVKPDLELALLNLTLETKRQIDQLTEVINLQSRAHAELKEDFEAYAKMQSEIVEAHREDLRVLTAKCATLHNNIAVHKHAVSGEAMLPMEASQ